MTKRFLIQSKLDDAEKRLKPSASNNNPAQVYAEDLAAIRAATVSIESSTTATNTSQHVILGASLPISTTRPNSRDSTTISSSPIFDRENDSGDDSDNEDSSRNWLSGVVRRHPRVGSSFQAITLPSVQSKLPQSNRPGRAMSFPSGRE